jgi:hypothetical protein
MIERINRINYRPSPRGSFIRAPVCAVLPNKADLREVSAARYSFCLNHDLTMIFLIKKINMIIPILNSQLSTSVSNVADIPPPPPPSSLND